MRAPASAAATLLDGDDAAEEVQIVRPVPRLTTLAAPETVVDQTRAELAVAELLSAFGVDLGDESLVGTPAWAGSAMSNSVVVK